MVGQREWLGYVRIGDLRYLGLGCNVCVEKFEGIFPYRDQGICPHFGRGCRNKLSRPSLSVDMTNFTGDPVRVSPTAFEPSDRWHPKV